MGLLEATLAGLGTAGAYADKYTGGRALRGVLGGHPREALSFLPGSDVAGITDPRDLVSGRDLTDQFGLTRRGDDSLLAHGLGMGAEVLLDPISLGAGALGGMAAARKLGAADKAGDVLDAIRGFHGDESGALRPHALGLKFDDAAILPESLGLSRSDPEWVNNRTFFHGTGSPDITASSLDPMRTDPEGLFGRGIYTTDNPTVASEYAATRSSEGMEQFLRTMLSPGRTRKLIRDGHGDELMRLLLKDGDDMPPADQFRAMAEHHAGRLASDISLGLADVDSPYARSILDFYANRLGISQPRLANTIYRGQSNFGKILDLESEMPPQEYQKLKDALMPIAERSDSGGLATMGDGGQFAPNRYAQDSMAEMPGPYYPTTPGGLIDFARLLNAGLPRNQPDALVSALKSAGYDALTHTGGQRMGNVEHQVVIGLDPNDVLGVGRSTPYKVWEALKGSGGKDMPALLAMLLGGGVAGGAYANRE